MGGSDQSSGDADKSPTHASQGLPSEKETDLNSDKNKNTKNNQPCQKDMMGASSQPFQSIWDKPKSFNPYLTMKPIDKKDLSSFADLSSGKIWKQLKTLRVNKIGRVDRTADSLMINVNSAEDSEQLLKCTEFCGLPVEVTPHSSLNCSKGVIKNGWLKGSTARELVDDLDCATRYGK